MTIFIEIKDFMYMLNCAQTRFSGFCTMVSITSAKVIFFGKPYASWQ